MNQKALSLRLVVAVALCAALAAPVWAAQQDLQVLLDGVQAVNASGLPGPVCAFGDEAFAYITGGAKGGASLPLAVATRYGTGRAVALGKGEFLVPEVFKSLDTGRMILNALHWAAGKAEGITVGTYQRPGFAEALQQQGVNARDIALDELGSVDVVIVSPHRTTDADNEAIRRFILRGGGLVAGALGWGWQQLNPGKSLPEDMPANRLMAPMGVVWPDGMLDRTMEGGYVAGEAPSALTNASRALQAALAHSSGARKLSLDDIKQVSTVLSRTAQALPESDQILLPRLRELARSDQMKVTPTLRNPLKIEDVLSRLVLTMQTRQAMSAPAAEVVALPAAASFPGTVPDEAPRITETLQIDTAVPNWHSTGLYAAPGELLHVELPQQATDKGLRVRIGSTHCRNWHHASWARAPEITRQYSLTQTDTPVANAFGGLVYIMVPGECDLGVIRVTVRGAVQAPYFVLGQTGLDEWRNTLRNLPAPRAELASGKAIITVPSKDVRALDDPEQLMKLWDRILDLCADLAAWPSHDRKRPERYVADDQLCAGYMHAGYPIMIPTSAAPKILDVEHLTKEGNWGLYHETGHNHQSGDWTFGGTGEVTVNLFTLYVYDKLCGIATQDGRMARQNSLSSLVRYFDQGAPFDQWKRSPFLALAMYVQLQQAFGWEAFQQVFAEYRGLPQDQRPKSDDEKRDQWMVRFSRHVGKNLGPFFELWGVPTSQQARASVEALDLWMPEDFPPKHPRETRVAKAAKIVTVDSEQTGSGEAANMLDGFPDTIWHTRWGGEGVPGYPHSAVVDLGETMAIKGLSILPRQTGTNGWISRFELYLSQDGQEWEKAVARGTLAKDKGLKQVMLPGPQTCRYVRFVALEGFDEQVWASVAELDVIRAD